MGKRPPTPRIKMGPFTQEFQRDMNRKMRWDEQTLGKIGSRPGGTVRRKKTK